MNNREIEKELQEWIFKGVRMGKDVVIYKNHNPDSIYPFVVRYFQPFSHSPVSDPDVAKNIGREVVRISYLDPFFYTSS